LQLSDAEFRARAENLCYLIGVDRRCFGLLLTAAVLQSGALGAADLPSGEELLKRCIERSGGAERLANAKGVEMTGTVEMVGRNISGSVLINEQGEKSYSAIEFPGIGKIEEGYDGSVAWESSAIQGTRIKEGDEKAAVERSSSFRVLTHWKDYYSAIRTVGSDDVDGKPAWKVEMTPKQGKVETFYFDRDSGLLARMDQIAPSPLGEIPTEMDLTDYRVVEGVQTPFSMTQKVVGQTIAIRLDKVTYNANIAPGRFDLPAAVKELLNKKKPAQ
jgi:hypothetical protein